MTITHVKAHTKGVADPLAAEIEANRPRMQSKWGLAIAPANDDRLSVPIADPIPGADRDGIIARFLPWAWRRK